MKTRLGKPDNSLLNLALLAIIACAPTARAQTIWIDGFGDWFNPFNWSAGVPNPFSPTAFDAQINNGGTALILGGFGSVRRITLGAGGGHTGTVIVDGGGLTVNEFLNVGEGGFGGMHVANGADLNATVTVVGTFGGSDGTLTVADSGSTLFGHTIVVAELGSGTMEIGAGADVSAFHISLANSSTSSFGRITVVEPGSTLVADNTLWIGRTGVGELTVAAGGAVSAPTIDIGSNFFGSGLATILGTGSTMTSTNTLLVGNTGVGTIMISDGGRVNSIAIGLGFASSGHGTVTVTGTGSRLVDTFHSIYVGYEGSGVLNIANGGIVNVQSGFGTVVVGGTASGPASTLRIGTGAAPGTLEAGAISLFRANSKLELNHTGVIALGMPISGPGSVTQIANGTTSLIANNTFTGPLELHAGLLELSAGGRINNASASNVGNGVGDVVSMRITGAGSKWINTGSIIVGAIGTGTVTVQNGGELRSDGEILVNRFVNGNGAFTVTGAGSTASNIGEFRIADEGIGLVRVEAGGTLMSANLVELARQATANASAIVSGSGSLWTIGNYLDVGRRGTGSLRIESGGTVRNLSNVGYVGDEAGSMGTVVIDGLSSAWESNSVIVGSSGSGSVTISGGGNITTSDSTFALGAGSSGTGLITGAGSKWMNTGSAFIGSTGTSTVTVAAGGELRADAQILVNRFAAGNGTLIVDGAGSKATTNGEFRIADEGIGLVRVEAGGTITSGNAYIARNAAASNGTAIVTGSGSLWSINGFLGVGVSGTGSLRIENGGKVQQTSIGYLGFTSGSLGTAQIIGPGSTWESHSLIVGTSGVGSVALNSGGSIVTGAVTFGFDATGDGTAIIVGPGTTWSSNGAAVVGNFGKGYLALINGSTFTAAGGSGPVNIAVQPGSVGTVYLGFGNEPGTLNAGSVVFGAGAGFLNFYHSGELPFAIPISGPGTVTKTGAGTTTLSASSSYTGGTILNDGSLRVTNANGMGLGTGPVTVNPVIDYASLGLNFAQNANAGSIAVTVFSSPQPLSRYGGRASFTESASAGTATFALNGSTDPLVFGDASVFFYNNSTAGTATFASKGGLAANSNGGTVQFHDAANAGNATFTNHGGTIAGAYFGNTLFAGPATSGGSAHFTNLGTNTQGPGGNGNGGTTYFVGGTAGNATITNAPATGPNGSPGRTVFGNSGFVEVGVGGNATITNRAGTVSGALGGSTTFHNTSSAGNATITTEGGAFSGSPGATTRFLDNSLAGTATLINLAATAGGFSSGGQLTFDEDSSAQSAMITNRGATVAQGFGGVTFFGGNATAGSSTIINEGATVAGGGAGQTVFTSATASAGSANITANGGLAPGAGWGTIYFGAGSAANATLTALPGTNGGIGGFIEFQAAGDGGNATAVVQGDAALSIAGISATGTTLGSIAGSGNFLLGSKTLTVGSNNTSTEVSGSISGNNGTLTKVGTGTLTISAVPSYAILNANGGTTILESALGTGSSIANVNASATFAASQKLAALNIGATGRAIVKGALPAEEADLHFDQENAALNIGSSGVVTLTEDPFATAAIDGPAIVESVPEPFSSSLLACGILALLGRRPGRVLLHRK